jgi:hypothetical protein
LNQKQEYTLSGRKTSKAGLDAAEALFGLAVFLMPFYLPVIRVPAASPLDSQLLPIFQYATFSLGEAVLVPAFVALVIFKPEQILGGVRRAGIVIGLTITLALISLLFSSGPFRPSLAWYSSGHLLLMALLVTGLQVVNRQMITLAILGSISVNAVTGLVQYVLRAPFPFTEVGSSPLWYQDILLQRAVGLSGHPALLGACAGAGLVVLLGRVAAREPDSTLLETGLCGLVFLALCLSYDAVSLIATLVGLIVTIWGWSGELTLSTLWNRLRYPLVLIVMIASFFVVTQGRVIAQHIESSDSPGSRLAYREAGSMLIGNPLTGVGGGGFFLSWETLIRNQSDLTDHRGETVEARASAFLVAAAELGVAGGLIFLALSLLPLWSLAHLESPRTSCLSYWSWAGIGTSMLVMAFFHHTGWTLPQGMILYWLAWGVTSHYEGRLSIEGTTG